MLLYLLCRKIASSYLPFSLFTSYVSRKYLCINVANFRVRWAVFCRACLIKLEVIVSCLNVGELLFCLRKVSNNLEIVINARSRTSQNYSDMAMHGCGGRAFSMPCLVFVFLFQSCYFSCRVLFS